MESQSKHSRRKVLKVGMTALAVVPLVGLSERAFATQNTAVRKALKYQLDAERREELQSMRQFYPQQG